MFRLRRNFLQKLLFTVLILIILIYMYTKPTNLKESSSQQEIESNSLLQIDDACDEIAKNEVERRIQNVQYLCEKNHLGLFSYENGTNDLRVKDPPTPQYSYFFMNRDKNLAWCPVFKAGSTSWLNNMMIIAGISEAQLTPPPKQLSIWAREVYGEVVPGMDFDNSLKLLIVRHPFSRILSAYLDKLANSSIGLEHGTGHFYSKYGSKIVKKFRTDTTIYQKEPTFEEFVRYLIKTNLVQYSDDHWLPVYYSCTPCHVQYNYIAKLETYTRDQNCIIDRTHLNGVLKPKWKHKTAALEESPGSPGRLAQKYYSQLSKSQISQLYQKYYLDFLLFDYSYSTYLEFGRDE